jgi:hypothetical protein
LVLGLVLAAGATAAVFFTENPLYLRVALLAVCWAFVVAAFLAGNRRADQLAAAAHEVELRHAYDLELEREVAARHEYEAELESRLRHETEDAVRAELSQLRGELAALTEMKGELAGLGELRAALTGLGELRADLGRMRSELTEQLSGELHIERMVMRAQSVRGPAPSASGQDDRRTVDGVAAWAPQVSGSAGGWEVDRWAESRVVPAEAAPRPVLGQPPVPPPADSWLGAEPAAGRRPPSPIEWLVEESVLEPWVQPSPPSPREWLGDRALLDEHGNPTGELPAAVGGPAPEPSRHRRSAETDDDRPASWAARPSELPSYGTPAHGTPVEPPPVHATAAHDSPYDGPAYDELLFGTSAPAPAYQPGPAVEPSPYEWPAFEAPSYGAPSYEAPSYEAPSYEVASAKVPSVESSSHPATSGETELGNGSTSYDASGYAGRPAQSGEQESSGHARLEQILAESGVQPPSGARPRRRRYRDEAGESADDDVLARVLRQP